MSMSFPSTVFMYLASVFTGSSCASMASFTCVIWQMCTGSGVTLHSAGSGVLCETSSGAAAIVPPSGVTALSPILMLTSSVGKSMLL